MTKEPKLVPLKTVHVIFTLKPTDTSADNFRSQLREATRYCRFNRATVDNHERQSAFSTIVDFLEEIDRTISAEAAQYSANPSEPNMVQVSQGIRHMFWLHQIKRRMVKFCPEEFDNQVPFAGIEWFKIQLRNFRSIRDSSDGQDPETAIKFLNGWTAVAP